MLKRIVVAVLLPVVLAGAPLHAGEPQDELPVTLNCKPPSFKVKLPPASFKGNCPLPNGSVLRITLQRIAETLEKDQLLPNVLPGGGGPAEIVDKKFTLDTVLEGPGKYMALINFPLELQEKDTVAEIQKKTSAKGTWSFEFLLWGDDLVPLLSTKLGELGSLTAEVRDLLKRMAEACNSEQTWLASAKALIEDGKKVNTKVMNSDLKAYFPAAMNNLYYTIRNIIGNAPYYKFANGKFAPPRDYHTDMKEMLTFRQEPYTWENLKRYVEETVPCAGREFSLWIVKDLRRTAGQMRPEIQDAIKAQKNSPGVDLYAERLAKATISDLDPLEAEIRGIKK